MIAHQIAATIAPSIEHSEFQRITAAAPIELDAWEYCLRGNALIYEMREVSILNARKMFANAIALDPSYSRAYSGLAFTYSIGLRFFREENRIAGTKELFESAKRAVELDRSDPKAHIVMSLAYMYANPSQPEYAVAEAKEAVSLNPDDPQAKQRPWSGFSVICQAL